MVLYFTMVYGIGIIDSTTILINLGVLKKDTFCILLIHTKCISYYNHITLLFISCLPYPPAFTVIGKHIIWHRGLTVREHSLSYLGSFFFGYTSYGG